MASPSVLALDKTPEELRGLPPAKRPVNWEALALVCDEMEGGSRLARERIKKKLFKKVKEDGIGILLPSMRLSYVSARLYLGDFSDWWGWEFRGFYAEDDSRTWAADLYWSETWLPKWGGGYVPRLLVLGEQGLGDQIFYASVIPEAMVRCGQVVYECDDRLHTLLERSLPGLKCEPQRQFEERRPGDAYIPGAELLRMFRRARSHFPAKTFLRPDADRVAALRRYQGRTGIGWSGRQGRVGPLELSISRPVSLQWNETHPDIETPEVDLKSDIEGVLALCSVLERVVCVPSTIHHVAGGCGAKTQIIVAPYGSGLRNQIPWDYPPGKLPWYPDAFVYRDLAEWHARGRTGNPLRGGRRDNPVGYRPGLPA